MGELSKRAKKYYSSLSDEDVLSTIRHLTNLQEQMGSFVSQSNQLQSFKSEADRRGLEYRNAN